MYSTLYEDYVFVRERYVKDYDILGTFFYGSQNYGLDTVSSDFDSITLIIPKLSTLVKKMVIVKLVKNFTTKTDIILW